MEARIGSRCLRQASAPERLAHLSLRFFGSLLALPPSGAERSWVAARLRAGEWSLWWRLSRADKRHTISVARRVEAAGQGEDAVAAALVHDVGKLACGLGTFGRVLVTLAAELAGRKALLRRSEARPKPILARAADYLRHDEIGADLLAAAGARPLAVQWARGHHLPVAPPGVPAELAEVLRAADGD